jgi:hypothetical protein
MRSGIVVAGLICVSALVADVSHPQIVLAANQLQAVADSRLRRLGA